MSIKQIKDSFYIKLAYQQAKINVGSTGSNPSVGVIVVKNSSVISSASTSLNGRPHAEVNALTKKINFKNSDLYLTLEPCSHYGKTPPCTKKIINKKIKRVIFSINDIDPRSKNLSSNILRKKKIKTRKCSIKTEEKNFYSSYFLQHSKQIPYTDAKLAVSKDFFSISKKKRWVTNNKSRKLANFLRSEYDCLLTTSKTINDDNPLLNCRIEGLEKKSPNLVIIDRLLNIKKNSAIFSKDKRKIYIFTYAIKPSKEIFLKKKGVKIIKLKDSKNNITDLKNIFYKIKKIGYNRILVESGVTFLDLLVKNNFIKNFYLFKASTNLGLNGSNNSIPRYLKKINFSDKNKINVNLNEDNLYKAKI